MPWPGKGCRFALARFRHCRSEGNRMRCYASLGDRPALAIIRDFCDEV